MSTIVTPAPSSERCMVNLVADYDPLGPMFAILAPVLSWPKLLEDGQVSARWKGPPAVSEEAA
ncbi:hypothetical protein [Bradyrhizobium sp. SZCCHNR1051]|uniref:hypothetical protein n=1 Tax=Bradyrhizobium sp. SZCCHNR1051 TaxID=3057355 RepID=UPI002916E61A|nr:hypothetical protein [Bradyrhizobium sp. SZCCHNR1051]